ncbi:MAG: C-type lectin domain-containing protein [Clostridia bacterium]|nr:C-type lectin domain-containing protein [Clostridia bacterium]
MKKRMKALACAIVMICAMFAGATVSQAQVPADALVFGNNAYYVFTDAEKRDDAQEHCEKLSGHLVYIESASEQEFLLKNVSGYCWIGAVNERNTTWTWGEYGPVIEYSKWASGNAPAATDDVYAKINGKSGDWVTGTDEEKCAYICEWENGAAALTTTTTTTTATTTETTTATAPDETSTSEQASQGTTAEQSTTYPVEESQQSTEEQTQSTSAQSTTKKKPTTTKRNTFTTRPVTVTALPDAGITSTTKDIEISDTIYIHEGTFYYQIVEGKTVMITYYIGGESDVVIPPEIDSKPVTHLGARAFQEVTAKSAVIPECVVSIEESTFSNVDKDFIIYGKAGSVAETFANSMGYAFSEQSLPVVQNTVELTTAEEEVDSDSENNNLRYIFIAVVVLAAIAAVAAVVIIKKKKSSAAPAAVTEPSPIAEETVKLDEIEQSENKSEE